MKDVYHLHDNQEEVGHVIKEISPSKEKERDCRLTELNHKMKLMGYLIMFE